MRNGVFTEVTEEKRKTPVSLSPAIWGEIAPYEFMGDSHRGNHEIITSRTRHKEVLKEGGYIEVGNEVPQRLRKARVRAQEAQGE
jgi:hypothetical protein